MKMDNIYFGVIFPAIEGGYVILFPDIPEAVSEGDTYKDCLYMGRDVLFNALKYYKQTKRSFPAGTGMADALAWGKREQKRNPECWNFEKNLTVHPYRICL